VSDIERTTNVDGTEAKAGNERCQEQEKQCVTNVYCGQKEKEKHSCCCCCPPPVETCTFDIYMTRVRLTDTNLADGKGELILTGYANGQSKVFPGSGTWIVLAKNWGWRYINAKITDVTIPKGTSWVVPIGLEAIEAEGWLGGRWEFGAGPLKFLTCQCGQQSGAEYIEAELKKPTVGADTRAKVEVEFLAVPRSL
jgi:hypothetical protein